MLNFANRTLECTSLNSQPQRLDQMAAGHFMLLLLPLRWPRLDGGSWRKCGLDNIIELKLKAVDWLKRRISEGLSGHPNSSDAVVEHEHVLTESGMYASETLMSLHEANLTECEGWAQEMSASQKQQFPRQHPLRRPGARAGNGSSASSLASCACGPGEGDASVIVTLGPVAQKTLMAECRQAFAPYRWRGFIMRLLGRRQWYEQACFCVWWRVPTCAICPIHTHLCLRCSHGSSRPKQWLAKLLFLVLTIIWHWKPNHIQPRTYWSFKDFEIELAGALHSWKTPC